MGWANHETWVEVVNETAYTIVVKEFRTYGSGWDKNNKLAKNFKNKEILSEGRHAEKVYIESNDERNSYFTMSIDICDSANTVIDLPQTNQREVLNINDEKETCIYSSDTYNVRRLMGKKVEVEVKKGEKKKKTASKFIIKEGKSEDGPLRFAVMSDTHFTNIYDDKNIESDIDNFVKSISQLDLKPQFLAICGDLTSNNVGGVGNHSQEYWLRDFIDKVEDKSIPVYEGFGGHDLLDIITKADIAKYIKDRNKKRGEDGRYEFEYSTNKYFDSKKKEVDCPYHYTWKMYCKGVSIRFFMLNNVPGYGEILSKAWVDGTEKDRKKATTKEEKYERDPKDSLTFLENQLKKLGKDDYYVLFFHTNFQTELYWASQPERWWSYDSRQEFYDVIKNGNGKYLTSFFGHMHSIGGGTNGKTAEEILSHVTIQSDNNDTDNHLYGYRCKCTGGKGIKYFNIVDFNRLENILELTIRLQEIADDGKVSDGKIYLLKHDDENNEGWSDDSKEDENGECFKYRTVNSVTLQIDITTGKINRKYK